MMESPYKGKTGFKRIFNALLYSIDGLVAAFRHEDAFRQELALALVLVPIALSMPVNATGKALMILAVMLVLVVELLNSAVEAVTDRVSLKITRSRSARKTSAAPPSWCRSRACRSCGRS